MNRPYRIRRVLLLLALIAIVAVSAIGLGPARPTIAAPDAPNIDLPLPNIWVNTTALTADPSDTKCDLWEALQAVFQANYGLSPTYNNCTAKVGGMNIIGFSVVGGTITVPSVGSTSDLPFVHGETVIVGPITIAGTGTSNDTHLLRTAPGAKLTVIATVLKNAWTSGAGPAIYSDNYATVNVIGSFLVNNVADGDGGAIYSNGDLNLMGTSFINNKALGLAGGTAGVGGAIYATGIGSFKSQACTYTNNQATAGGAIYLIKPGGESSISESIFTANGVSADANGFGGGAVYNANTGGTLEINRTAFNANYSTQGAGGAIVNKISASTYISNTLFDANVAGDSSHARNGGAIYNQGPLQIVKSTFFANVADGGSGGALSAESNGVVNIGNSTFYGNLSDQQGGALYASATANLNIRNTTFSANIAGSLGDVLYLGGTAHANVGNTIFDGTFTPHPNCAGNAVTSLGHNIDTGSTCAANAGLGDMLTNPLLGPLGFHGGSLPVLTTQVPDYASPAIDHGDPTICTHPTVDKEDETGSSRPKDANNVGGIAACDVGAIEVDARKPAFDAEPMPPGPINFGSVQINHTVTATVSVHNAGNYTLTLSNPVIGDPAHFGIVSGLPGGWYANETRSIVLSCTPTVQGQVASTVSFNTTDPDRAAVSYTVICNGTPAPAPSFAALPVAPGPIEYGEITIGQMVTQTITFKNSGNASLFITPTGFTSDSGNFAHTFAAPLNVAPGATSQIAVRCQPNKVGALVGKLIFQTNDAAQNQSSYNLNCYGVPPQSAYLVNTSNLKSPFLPGSFTNLFGLALSPDGLNAYVTGNVPAGGQVAVLRRQTSGLLAGTYLSETEVTNVILGAPHNTAVSPDGQYVVTTGGTDGTIAFYQRNDGNGSLTPLNSYSGIFNVTNPFGATFSPDGKFAYVTDYNYNAIHIFQHIANGYFYNSVVTATTMTTHTLQNPTGIVVSPDGKSVYVAVHTSSATAGTLAVYRRNTVTGALTPIQTRYDGDVQDSPDCFICFPVNGLSTPYDLAISPDGYNVYVSGYADNGISNFRRDPVTGLLNWYGSIYNGGSVSGLAHPYGIVVSPDNKHVYVAGEGSSALVMLNRNTETGYLTFREAYVRDAGGSPALLGVHKVAVTNDGQYVLAVSGTDKAVAVFQMANPVPTLFSLQPASVAQGSAQFTLVVKGSGFVEGASLWWDGTHPVETFINSSEMRATIPASYLTSAGNHTIMIKNPSPGGGDSYNTLTFKVIAPAATPIPSIDHLSPAGVVAGAAGVQVDIYGSNFSASGLSITANGGGVVGNFIDSTHVKITSFNVNTFAQPGTVNIQVNNNGVQSNIVGLDVAAPGQNPVPSITALSPDWVWSLGAASPELTLVITGTNFVDGAVVLWNGNERPTKFISKTRLQATIYGTDQLDPASNSVVVQNPGPGGGESNVLSQVVRALFQLLIPFARG